MLKGTIYITDREDIVYSANSINTRIINLDEDGTLIKNQNIIGGTCLLPPIDAKLAEADGNEMLYDTLYSNHLLEEFQREFIAALIAYLYRGGNLLLFLTEVGYDNTKSKLVFHFFKLYGIHIGILNNPDPSIANCYYDNKCIPLWLNLLYGYNIISGKEYLYKYPEDAIFTNNNFIMNKLLSEFNPYSNTINEAVESIVKLHKLIHKNPNIESPICNLATRGDY